MIWKPKASRREFLQSATALSAAAAVPMSTVVAGCSYLDVGGGDGEAQAWKELATRLKEPRIYTAEDPGNWEGRADDHVPVTVLDGSAVMVSTIHPQGPAEDEGHYILAYFAEDTAGNVFDFRMYTRFDRQENGSTMADMLVIPSSYAGEIRVYQYCTKHDLWMTTITK